MTKEEKYSYQKKYREKNAERLSEIGKVWRLKNNEKLRENKRTYYINNKERLIKYQKEHRVNNLDYIKKKRADFYFKNKEEISKKRKQWRIDNREKNKIKRKQDRIKNFEKLNEIKKKWVSRNWSKVYARQKRWRKENKERFAVVANRNARKYYKRHRDKCIAWAKRDRLLNPEKHRERLKRYRKNNPEVIRAIETRKRKAGKVSPDDLKNLMIVQEGNCFYCGSNISNKYHIDHYVPITLGGLSNIENIVLTCPPCNLKKHTKHGDVFISEIKNKKCA